MDKKLFTIGVLSITAVVLLVANLIQPRVADASFVVKDNDYTAVTARIAKGGEALYVLDNRTGMMAVLYYDPGKRQVLPLGVPRLLQDAFGAGLGVKPKLK